MTKLFQKLDANGDGTVTKAEAQAYWQKNWAKVNATAMFIASINVVAINIMINFIIIIIIITITVIVIVINVIIVVIGTCSEHARNMFRT